METLVFILMLLVCFNFALNQTFMKPWHVVLVAVALAVAVGCSWPLAIEQSKSQIAQWLANKQLMLDTSVVLTLEVAWQMAYCLLATHIMFEDKMPRKVLIIYRILRFFPGILILPILFAALVGLIYQFTGFDFKAVAWGFAVTVAVVLPAVSFGLRRLLPEKILRLEILFLTNALLLILGIIATVNGTTSFHGSDEVNWNALFAFIILLSISALCGFLIYRHKTKNN